YLKMVNAKEKVGLQVVASGQAGGRPAVKLSDGSVMCFAKRWDTFKEETEVHTNSSMAKAMHEFAEEYKTSALKRWKFDSEMIKMFLDDYSSYRGIARLIGAGKIKEAYDKASNLEAAAREEIPERVRMK